MPLHDWTNLSGWEGLHDIWIVELLRHIKPQLPEGYRAYIGSTPALTIDAPNGKPDVAVRQWLPEMHESPKTSDKSFPEPDVEVATLSLDPQTALYVTIQGRMIAAVELVSPRNKDRPTSRAHYLSRYLSYLQEGAHLLLVDVHPRPLNFSFADALAQELNLKREPCPPPLAISYRVGEPAAQGGRLVGIWQRGLSVGQPLPSMQLALSVHAALSIDLETTYQKAAADIYLT